MAHVGKKVVERRPALTYNNPTSTVIRIGPAVRVVATLAHAAPYNVLLRASSPVFREYRAGSFPRETSAAPSIAATNVISPRDTTLPTITLKFDVLRVDDAYDRESTGPQP